ncbi:MAG: 50S ribosomal protein L11 methyltransferase [Longimicrobiales bacterium]
MNEELIELTVTCPSDDVAGLVAEGLVLLGLGGVEELPGAVRAWVTTSTAGGSGGERGGGGESGERRAWDHTRGVGELQRRLEEFVGQPLDIAARVIPVADWSAEWRRGLRARRVGRRIVVAPTWTTPDLRDGDVLLSIDPEMAFGTGEHGTTRGMLRLLQEIDCEGARVLDVGTGSAILAIAAALLGATHVDAVESDADALINARDNVERHGVHAQVQLTRALVDSEWLEGRGDYDVILANILSSVIRPLLPAFRRALRPGGALLLSGILEEEADDVLADAAAAGFALRVEDLEDEWWSARLQSE